MTSSAVQWDPPTASGRDANSPITYLYVIACHPVMTGSSDIFAPPSKSQTNHWMLFFATGENTSIRVDPSLGNGNRLSLQLTHKPNLYTDKNARCFEFQPNDFTTKEFLECIIEARYDQYKFSSSLQGCRHWIARVLELLEDKGYLHDVAAAVDATNVVWEKDGTPVPDDAQSIGEKGVFL